MWFFLYFKFYFILNLWNRLINRMKNKYQLMISEDDDDIFMINSIPF
jgi:hypothetical protein